MPTPASSTSAMPSAIARSSFIDRRGDHGRVAARIAAQARRSPSGSPAR